MKTEVKYIIVAVVIVVIFLLGLYIGRKTVKVNESVHTEYITLPPVHDSIPIEKPSKQVPPDTARIIEDCVKKGLYSELFPYKEVTDTVYTDVDTANILKDWATERFYAESLFDIDTVGKCDIDVQIQYNRLSSLKYTYTPIQKQSNTVIIKEKTFEPFIGGGITIGVDREKKLTEGVALQGGFYVKQKYGVSLQYQYLFGDIQNHEITGQFLYKF